MKQVFLNYYTQGNSDITYKEVIRKDLEYCKPILVSEEEFERIKNCTVEQVFKILEDNKF